MGVMFGFDMLVEYGFVYSLLGGVELWYVYMWCNVDGVLFVLYG